MFALRSGVPAVLACLLCTAAVARAQKPVTEDVVNNHITVTAADLYAADSVRGSSYHVTPTSLPGSKPLAAALNAEGIRAAVEDRAFGPEAVISNTVPSPGAPYFYPADLAKGTGPSSITLTSTTQHALYVDYAGTIAANWGNPVGFLSDLNKSTFIHLVDQYVGFTTALRYPVGTSANVSYGFYGNILYTHEIYAIVHAAAVAYGRGTGHVYHVFFPKGIDTCFDGGGGCYSPDIPSLWSFCAYHDAVTFSDIGLVLFTVEPFQDVPGCAVATPSPNGQLADSTNSVLSHELFETITDPIPGYAFINRQDLDLNGYEIGDECQPLTNSASDFLVPTFLIDGHSYEVQLEYSNHYHACAAQP